MKLTVLKTLTKNVTPKRSLAGVHAIVIHNTGDSDLDKVLNYYGGSDEKVNPHFLIETTGLVRCFAEPDTVAYHCKLWPEEKAAYAHGYGHWSRFGWDRKTKKLIVQGEELSNYEPWRLAWPTLRSPLEHPTGSFPNGTSIGIELLKPLDTQRTPDLFVDAQYEALALLVRDVCERLEIPEERRNILGHYDVSPITRSDIRGGYDPGHEFNWSRLFKTLRELQP